MLLVTTAVVTLMLVAVVQERGFPVNRTGGRVRLALIMWLIYIPLILVLLVRALLMCVVFTMKLLFSCISGSMFGIILQLRLELV